MLVRSLLFSLLFLLCSMSMAQDRSTHKQWPKDGYVPNEETAIKIALAVWEPIYGAGNIARQAPYTAELKDGVWIVQGTLPKNVAGGTAVAAISKKDGTILQVFHGK